IGNGVIFKLVPYYFQKQAGTANGIVSMMGGLGGFFPPLLLSAIFSMTGSYSIGFMAFSQFALVSLLLVLWMYYMDRINLSQDVFNSAKQGIIVTDQQGKIVSVNNSFIDITGYGEEEAIGEQANILSSGNQDKELFTEMWEKITSEGEWNGEILNKHKNGEEYKQAMSISAVYDASGEVMRYVGTLADMKDKQSVKTT